MIAQLNERELLQCVELGHEKLRLKDFATTPNTGSGSAAAKVDGNSEGDTVNPVLDKVGDVKAAWNVRADNGDVELAGIFPSSLSDSQDESWEVAENPLISFLQARSQAEASDSAPRASFLA
jgi:hypothetical protein